MSWTSRRDFLRRLSAAAPALVVRNGVHAAPIGTIQALQPAGARPQITRYLDPLPIPKRLEPYGKRGDTQLYRIRMIQFEKHLHSQLPPTRLWGYEGQVPGPTIEAVRGQPIEVEWQNHLPDQHLFLVDPHIHGAMPPAPAVRTVPHVHGSRTDSTSDGLPEKWFTPGQSVRYRYPNDQQAAPLWYHDHALGITRLNLHAGLSGFYFLRDEQESSLGLPSGDFEIPLILQDRTLDDQGQLLYAPSLDDGTKLPPGIWGPQFFGESPLVNGTIYPFLEVEPRPYRLRLLNAANTRFFRLDLNLAKNPADIPALVTMRQIGTDGGLLPAPADVQKLLLAPAERADLIVDFSGLEDKIVTLSNDAPTPYPGWNALHSIHAPLLELMQFRVTRPLSRAKTAFSLPPQPAWPHLNPEQSVATRDFILTDEMDAHGRSLRMLINGKGYDEPVTDFPKLGSTETWRFFNTTDDAHPMHIHLVQFRILARQGFDQPALAQGNVRLIGTPRPPAPNEAGWKDTAIVNPQDSLTLLVRFDGFAGKYVLHCHVAEHEDNDMMRPFEVVPADPQVPASKSE